MVRLAQSALAGTALILTCALLRSLLKARLSPNVRLCLWGVCLFRLLSPVVPACPWSLWGLLPRREPAMAALPALPTAPPPAGNTGSGMTLLTAAYLLGGALVLGWSVYGWVRARQEVSWAPELPGDDPRYMLVPRCARLREGPVAGAPLTFGVLRPAIVLAPGLQGEQLSAVLAHEGVHARRRDNLWHYVTAAALVLYWWDPAVWLMARLLRRDVELSCDRAVAMNMDRHERAEYARAILEFSTQAEGIPFCRRFGQKQAEERIFAMLNFKKTTIAGAVLSLALVGTLGTALATSPETAVDAEPAKAVSYSYSIATSPESADKLEQDLRTGVLEVVTSEAGKVAVSHRIDSLDMEPITSEGLDEYLEELRARVARQVKDGEMTQAEGDKCVENVEAMRKDLADGAKIYRTPGPGGEDTYVYVSIVDEISE